MHKARAVFHITPIDICTPRQPPVQTQVVFPRSFYRHVHCLDYVTHGTPVLLRFVGYHVDRGVDFNISAREDDIVVMVAMATSEMSIRCMTYMAMF